MFEILARHPASVTLFILGVSPKFEVVSRRYFSGSQLIENQAPPPKVIIGSVEVNLQLANSVGQFSMKRLRRYNKISGSFYT